MVQKNRKSTSNEHLGYVCVVTDQHYMRRALDLAQLGLGSVSPNPMVGCVIVNHGKIIGEGWHKEYGKAHAEVNAVDSVKDRKQLREATLYITLEPCSFQGKTPACTDLIKQIKPKKVVVASLDPNPKVSGTGLEILKQAGIEVEFGVLEAQAIALNRRFFVNMILSRPYVILKWAETNDGYIAKKNFDSKWISNTMSRQLVHKWRAEEDAILVGYNTAKHDDPSLTVREWEGSDPVRIVLDPKLELSVKSKLMDQNTRVYIINDHQTREESNLSFVKLSEKKLEHDLLKYLYTEGIGSVIIEGGTTTINKFIQAGLWDETRKFTAPVNFEDGIKAPFLLLESENEQKILEDRLSIIYNPKTKKLWQKN